MKATRCFLTTLLIAGLCMVAFAKESKSPIATTPTGADISGWSIGLSAISPGMPVAVKAVYQKNTWGFQMEANYFYALGMVRLDGRKGILTKDRLHTYGFVGITGMHFNDHLGTAESVNNTFLADVGAGISFRFGKRRRFELGAEGGLLLPFYSNQGLEQYKNSGLMVANIFALWQL